MAQETPTFRRRPTGPGPGPALLLGAVAIVATVLLARFVGLDRREAQLWLIDGALALGALASGLESLTSRVAWTRVDDDGVTVRGLFATRAAHWNDVASYEVIRNSGHGVRLELRGGRRVDVTFGGLEGLREAVEARLRALPPPSVEGRVFRAKGRIAGPLMGFGFMGALCAMFALDPKTGLRVAWLPVAFLGPVFVPLTLWGLTAHVVLRDGVLTMGSLFGKRSLALADVRRAEITLVHRRREGKVERFVLVGPEEISLDPGLEGYATLRDAVLAELPARVRPRLPG